MKRKVIQIADSTQLISLPRKWAIAHNVKKGDELEIEEQGDRVVVSTNKGVSFEKITVDISKLNEKLVHWTLYILHKSGYDEIELTYNDHKIAKVIQDTISEGIMGFEIIEQTPKYCLIKNIATGLESEFETILKRIFLVTISMAKTSYDIISKSQFENLKEIIVLETTNNKLTNFCERLLNQKGYKNITKTSFLYVIVWQFEKIADDFRDLCEFLVEHKDEKISLSKELMSVYQKTINIIENFYEAFYKYEDEKLVSIADDAEKVKNEVLKIFKSKKYTEIIIGDYLSNISKKVLELCASCMGLKLPYSVGSK